MFSHRMVLTKEFAAVERRAAMLGLSAYEVASQVGFSKLRYWRARTGAVKRIACRMKVLNPMLKRLAELEERKANNMDLFDYPAAPGYKDEGTSKDAAKSVAGKAPLLRARVLAELSKANGYGLTAHECAARLGETVFSIAPRLTELHAQNKVIKSDKRRPNASGRYAVVWKAA